MLIFVNHMKYLQIHFFLLIAIVSCNNVDEIFEKRGKLVSYEYVNSINAANINDFFDEKNELEGNIDGIPKYDIDIYRIIYTSVFKGEIIELSGLIVLPKKDGALSHLQYHHGTLFPYEYPEGEGSSDAPSLYDATLPFDYWAQSESRIFGNYLGSYGYLVSLPDYVGYAHSNLQEHPYSVNNMLAEQSVDMILATKTFCSEFNINLNDNLFLSGWSEGASVSLATQKLIEAEYENELKVTGNAPLAGFYNMTYYARLAIELMAFLELDLGEDLNVLMWALYSINAFSDSPIPADNIYKYPVNNQLDVLSERPSSIPAELFRNPTSQVKHDLINKFSQQSLAHGWSPKAPVFLHHGTRDDVVYYDNNALITKNNLNRNGGDVILYTYNNHNHYSLVLLYLLKMIEDFDELM